MYLEEYFVAVLRLHFEIEMFRFPFILLHIDTIVLDLLVFGHLCRVLIRKSDQLLQLEMEPRWNMENCEERNFCTDFFFAAAGAVLARKSARR